MLVRLSSKGQLVLPKRVRQALGLQPGTLLDLRLGQDSIILEPVRATPIAALYGKYSDSDLLTDLEAEHRQEIADEAQVRA
jgi:AbrB family looped-hinge helix DNA binding protein